MTDLYEFSGNSQGSQSSRPGYLTLSLKAVARVTSQPVDQGICLRFPSLAFPHAELSHRHTGLLNARGEINL